MNGRWVLLLAMVALAACGGSDGGGGAATATPTGPPTLSPTVPSTSLATLTPTIASGSATATATPTATQAQASPSRTPTSDVTQPTATGTATATEGGPTSTPTASPIPSETPTITATPGEIGPEITYFGLVRPDGCQQGCFDTICFCNATPTPSYDDHGRQMFESRGNGRGLLVVEGRPGRSGLPPGILLETQGTERPDLWVESSQTLGDGSSAVCDRGPDEPIGGIPSVDPPDFGNELEITGALQDFACRFAVQPSSDDACTLDNFGNFSFVNRQSTIQFCNQVSSAAAFPPGVTVLTAHLLDVDGNVGPMKQVVIVNPASSSSELE